MNQLGRPLKDVIIIDNSPPSFMFTPENGIPILSWYDNKKDRVLLDYISVLK